MECQDATAHTADYLAGVLPVEKIEALVTHTVDCAACRSKLTARGRRMEAGGTSPGVAPDPTAMRRRFEAVLAEHQANSAAVRETFGYPGVPHAISPARRVPGYAVQGSFDDRGSLCRSLFRFPIKLSL